jgi:hypothetical protein
MTQCLDYQGIPFRCSYYRRTGHLRRDCTNWTGSVDTKDDEDSPLFNGYMEQVEPEPLGGFSFGTDEHDSGTHHLGSILGKLQTFCPILFSKLSAWE